MLEVSVGGGGGGGCACAALVVAAGVFEVDTAITIGEVVSPVGAVDTWTCGGAGVAACKRRG